MLALAPFALRHLVPLRRPSRWPRSGRPAPSPHGASASLRGVWQSAAAVLAWIVVAAASPASLDAQGWEGIDRVQVDYPGDRGFFEPREAVELWAGEEVFLRIRGPLLPTADRVELAAPGGSPVPGAAALIEDAGGDLGVRLTTNAALTSGGVYQLRIHFPVGKSRTLPVRMRERGIVTDIAHTGGSLTYGMRAEFTLSGTQIANAALDPRRIEKDTGFRLGPMRIVDRSPNAVRVAVVLRSAGRLTLEPGHVYDRSGDPPESDDRTYMGAGSGSWSVAISPAPASVSPTTVRSGDEITVTGERLDAVVQVALGSAGAGSKEMTLHLRYPRPRLFRDPGDPAYGWARPSSSDRGSIRFEIPETASTTGEYALEYRPPDQDPRLPEVQPVPLPVPLEVLQPPRVRWMRNEATSETIGDMDSDVRCRRDCALPDLTAGGRVVLRGFALSGPDGIPATVRFGAFTLEPEEFSEVQGSEDLGGTFLLAVRIPEEAGGQQARLTLQTSVDTWTSELKAVAVPPVLTGPLRVSELGADQVERGEGPYREVEGYRLTRNRHYVVEGRHLGAGTLTVGGQEWPSSLVTLSEDRVDFTVPADATSSGGGLAFETASGRSELLELVVFRAPPERLRMVHLPADTLASGDVLAGEARFDPSDPPPDGAWVFLSSSDVAVAQLPPRAPVRGDVAPFEITGGVVTGPTEVTIVAELDGVRREGRLRVVPPRIAPSALVLEHPNVVGDNPVEATVTLERPFDGYTVELESSRPELAEVPPTVTVQGDRARFTVRTASVDALERVRITARTVQGEVHADLGLSPRRATLAGIELPEDRFVGPAVVEATVRVANAVAGEPVEVTLRASPGIVVPASVRVTGSRAVVPVEIPAVGRLTRAGIEAESRIGRATVQFAIEPLTAELELPVRTLFVGARPVQATLRVSAPADRDRTFSLVTSAPRALRLPAEVVVPAGRVDATFSVEAIAVPTDGRATVEVRSDGLKEPLATAAVQVAGR